MRKITALATALASLTLAAPAGAQDITQDPIVQRDLAAAARYWHRTAPCPSYRVETFTPYVSPVGVQVAGTEIWGCVQIWNPEVWAWFWEAEHEKKSEQKLEMLRWECELTIHEYGHSLGRPDLAAPKSSIMYQAVGIDGERVPLCKKLYPGHVTRLHGYTL